MQSLQIKDYRKIKHWTRFAVIFIGMDYWECYIKNPDPNQEPAEY